jgi:hypothetical protein
LEDVEFVVHFFVFGLYLGQGLPQLARKKGTSDQQDTQASCYHATTLVIGLLSIL